MNIETLGRVLATAIHQTRKFREAEHSAALALLAQEFSQAVAKTPANLAPLTNEYMDYVKRLSNLSAVRQELEKCGAVTQAPTEHSALQRQVLENLAKLTKAATSSAK